MSDVVTSAIVVFGCPAGQDGAPSRALLRRLELGLALAHEHSQAWVVVSGGAVIGENEAQVMQRWLVHRGITSTRILSEVAALNTEQNAVHVAQLLSTLPVKRVWLVTDQFHMWRSALLLRLALKREGRLDIVVTPMTAADGKSRGRRIWLSLGEFWKLGGNLLLLSLRRRPNLPKMR